MQFRRVEEKNAMITNEHSDLERLPLTPNRTGKCEIRKVVYTAMVCRHSHTVV